MVTKTPHSVFQEKQYFRQFWVWALTIVSSVLTLIALKFAFPYPVPQDQMWLFWVGIVSGCSSAIGVPLFFLLVYLRTEVRAEGVYYKFVPLQRRFRYIPFDKIKSFRVVQYRPIADYGGWGIRRGREGRAYNVSEDMGILFELPNEETFLLGSRTPYDLFQAIKRAKASPPASQESVNA